MRAPEWTPDPERASTSTLTRFAQWLTEHRSLPEAAVTEYELLHEWSVTHLEDFWDGFVEFQGVKFHTPWKRALNETRMPGATWFEGATLNFTEHICRNTSQNALAITVEHEDGTHQHHTYDELRRDIARFAQYLTACGVQPGDRVVGYLPNSYEGVVALFATAGIGAVWAHTGMDYSASAAADRLAQLEPAVLITGTGYVFRGRTFDRSDEVARLRALLPSVRHTVVVNTLNGVIVPDALQWDDELAPYDARGWKPEPVDFSHPLWVLFTSGTTGKPKGIVHGHGGALLEQLKTVSLHLNVQAQDTFFWYTTPNWMMWNVQIAGLLFGAHTILYVGDPMHPSPARLWELCNKQGVTVFGTSPGQLAATQQSGFVPDVPHLRTIASTGSPLPASTNRWVRETISPAIQVSSVTGGTDVVGLFAGSSPISPVWDGEISGRALGVALEVWDEAGTPVRDQVGELVITKPLPSMPVFFWDDPDGSKYHAAYFDVFPGVWRHGDWVTLTSHGSVIMHGRSDATLNRRGIRLGSAEIYDAVESLPEVKDSLVIGLERGDADYWMPLFVVPSTGWDDERSPARIREVIADHASKHHIPDEVIVVKAIPRTRTGKKMEVPVKRVLQGHDPAQIGALGAADDPKALLAFAEFRKESQPPRE